MGDTRPGEHTVKKNTFQIQREESYTRLIEEGTTVFLEKGYVNTTIDDIAKAAGYTRGAFYFHFADKQDYFIHLLKAHDERRGSDFSKLPYQFDPNKTSLSEVFKTSLESLFRKVYGKSLSGWIFVVIGFYQQSKNDPALLHEMKSLHKTFESDETAFIRSLQDQGYISADLDPDTTALQLIMTTYGYLISYYLYDIGDLDMLIQAYLKIVS